MYFLASQLKNLPVMSLQTGQSVATLSAPVVRMADLEVLAIRCRTVKSRSDKVILMRDIRQFATDCIIVDSFDDVSDPEDIVRLRDVLAENFDPIGKVVVNETGHRLGKVEDFTINLKTFAVQKLYVHQSLMKSILFNNLTIDRSQITDITPKQFTVRDASIKVPGLLAKPLPQTPTES